MVTDVDIVRARLEGLDVDKDLLVKADGTYLIGRALWFTDGVVSICTPSGVQVEITEYHPMLDTEEIRRNTHASAHLQGTVVVMMTESVLLPVADYEAEDE